MCTQCLVVFISIMLSELTQFSLYPVAVSFQCSSATGGLKDSICRSYFGCQQSLKSMS